MLRLGEKGAIPQKQEDSYTIAPHIPCGVVTPGLLRKIADISEKYGAESLKITGSNGFCISGYHPVHKQVVFRSEFPLN